MPHPSAISLPPDIVSIFWKGGDFMGRMLEMPEIGGQFDPAETAIAERSDHVGPDEIVTIRAMVHRLGDQQEAPRAVYAIRQPNSVPNQHG